MLSLVQEVRKVNALSFNIFPPQLSGLSFFLCLFADIHQIYGHIHLHEVRNSIYLVQSALDINSCYLILQ